MLIRELTLDDHEASARLGGEAFGRPAGAPPPPRPDVLPAGRHVVGAFEDAGEGQELLGRVAAHEYESWWHGQRIATCGIAGVVVAAEHRGRGLLRPLFEAALEGAAGRGEPLSTLFPTATGIYRSLGYEVVTSLDVVELPTSDLAGVRPLDGTRTRRARVEDVPAMRAVYDAWAAAQHGPLSRTGPRFADTDEELLGEFTAVSLAVDAEDRVVGYAAWQRGEGYDLATSVLEVDDLVATTLDGYRALWQLVASHSSVVGRVRVTTSGHDLARLPLPGSGWRPVQRHPYMLRVDDPAGALTAARLSIPGLAPTVLGFAVAGDRLGRADGSYRLEVGAGPGGCERVDRPDDVPVFTPQGLALAFAGAQSCANLRMAGHLTGPDEQDRLWDALLGARPLHVRDYF